MICVAECDDRVLDLVFILDHSTSIGTDDWGNVVLFVTRIVNALTVSSSGTHVGVATFNEAATVAFRLDKWTTTQAVVDAIYAIVYNGGDTNIAGGLRVARRDIFGQGGDRSNVNNIAVLFTDGIANVDANDIDTEAASLKQVANVVTIGVSAAVDQDQLRRIATKPEWFIFAETFEELIPLSGQLAQSACKAVVIKTGKSSL